MVFEKKQLSKVLAIALMIACAVAFMPLLNGFAFAAAKKPAKVTVKSAKQVSGTYNVKVTWKKATNAKKYNVKVGSKTYKNKKGTSFTVKNLAVGTYKVKVQGVNGKKKGPWSATKNVAVKAVVAKVEITGDAQVGRTLTATAFDKNDNAIAEGVTYQWYRSGKASGGDNAIADATEATYKPVKADLDKTLYVAVTSGGKTVKSKETAKVEESNISEFGYMIKNSNAYHTAPVVGDFMMVADLQSADGSEYYWPQNDAYHSPDAIQWYEDGEAINGATLPVYNVSKYSEGKVLTAELKWFDQNGKEVIQTITTEPTEAVIKGTLPRFGMIVNQKDPDAVAMSAVVGDTLAVQFTDPENAADPEATYQWKRDGNAISGATGSEYTVKAADEAKTLSVEVTKSDKKSVTVFNDVKVKADLSKATFEIEKKAADEIGEIDYIYVKALKDKDGNEIDPDDYYVDTYIDNVSEESQFVSGPMHSADLVGHKLIFVAKATIGGDYSGEAVSEPTDMVTMVVGIESNGIYAFGLSGNTNSDGLFLAGKTELGAFVKGGHGFMNMPSVAFKWQKHVDGAWKTIDGAADATYVVTAQDAEDDAYDYRVIISDKDGYRVLEDANTAVYEDVEWWTYDTPGAAVVKYLNIENQTAAKKYAPPQVGDELSASCNLSTAENYMVYSWQLYYNGTEVGQPVIGKTYTVPDTAKKGYEVVLTATSSNNNEFMVSESADDVTTVQGTYTAELTSSASKYSGGAMTFDGVANPKVGDTLTVQLRDNESKALVPVDGADIIWFADDELIEEDDNTYVIDEEDFGKTITAVVYGGRGYYGAASNASTGVVDADNQGVVVELNGEPISSDTVLKINNVLVADTVYPVKEDVTYTWTIKAGDGKVYTETGDFLRIERRYLGGSVTVTASAPSLDPEKHAVTKTFDLAIQDWANN